MQHSRESGLWCSWYEMCLGVILQPQGKVDNGRTNMHNTTTMVSESLGCRHVRSIVSNQMETHGKTGKQTPVKIKSGKKTTSNVKAKIENKMCQQGNSRKLKACYTRQHVAREQYNTAGNNLHSSLVKRQVASGAALWRYMLAH